MEGISVALGTAIVLPVLVEAIHVIKEDADANDDPLVAAIKASNRDSGLKLDSDPLELAQQVLELPMKKPTRCAHACEGAY